MMGTWWNRCDGRTDRRTDGQTDRQTDWTSHIAAWSQLKIACALHREDVCGCTCSVSGRHYNDVIVGTMASQITSLTIVYSFRLFRHRSKNTSKLHVTGLSAGNSPATGEFPAQMARNAENVSIWWRHHWYAGLSWELHLDHHHIHFEIRVLSVSNSMGLFIFINKWGYEEHLPDDLIRSGFLCLVINYAHINPHHLVEMMLNFTTTVF